MQTKSVSKAISAKLSEWIESISDSELRHELKKNVLVSGGSITSLYLNEQVNDYDIYIMDRSVLLSLVNYYTKPYSELDVFDGKEKAALIDKAKGEFSTEEFLKHTSALSCSLRNLKEDQIKIFVNGGNGGFKIETFEGEEKKKYTPVFFSPNAISLSDDIQIVIRFHGSPEEIHKSFDFIHATNYFTFAKGVVINLEAVESILTKQLKYQGSLYPLTSVIRSKKFVKRGWNINAGEYLKMMFQISLLDLQDMDVLEEQLIGVDVAYFQTLINALRNHIDRNPDFKITPEYFNTLIDKVFNDAD